jgi:hypothetical protein
VFVIDFLARPWRGSTLWNALAYNAFNVPLCFLISVPIIVLVGLSIGLAVTFVVAIPVVWLTFLVTAMLGSSALYLRSQVGIAFRIPGIGYWATVLGGLAASLAVIASTFPLLDRITGPDVARNE